MSWLWGDSWSAVQSKEEEEYKTALELTETKASTAQPLNNGSPSDHSTHPLPRLSSPSSLSSVVQLSCEDLRAAEDEDGVDTPTLLHTEARSDSYNYTYTDRIKSWWGSSSDNHNSGEHKKSNNGQGLMRKSRLGRDDGLSGQLKFNKQFNMDNDNNTHPPMNTHTNTQTHTQPDKTASVNNNSNIHSKTLITSAKTPIVTKKSQATVQQRLEEFEFKKSEEDSVLTDMMDSLARLTGKSHDISNKLAIQSELINENEQEMTKYDLKMRQIEDKINKVLESSRCSKFKVILILSFIAILLFMIIVFL